MIAQVLSRGYVLAWLGLVEQELTARVDAGEDPTGEFAAALADIVITKSQGILGQPGQSAPSAGLSGEHFTPSLDEQSFLSRDPVVSLLQSAIEERVETARPDLLTRAVKERGLGRGVPDVTDIRLKDSTLEVDGKRGILGKFEPLDIRWVAETGLALALAKFRERHPFNPRPADPIVLAENARLVLVGDWGTGLPRAQRVALHMRHCIEEAEAAGRQVHVIHLGDVYYSGLPREYEQRFLPYWPVNLDEAGSIYSWCINGNHDMYSGGHGYFDTLLADPRFACQQRSSWFSLHNEHWRIVGLDTAWDERGIRDDRTERGLAAPQCEQLQQWAAEDDRPFMLLSHHQLFSSYERTGPYLGEVLSPLLDAGRVRAWLWGHEHKGVVYEPYDGVRYGRCAGHGGVPVYAVGAPEHEPEVVWVERRILTGADEPWAVFGFAVADFDGPEVRLTYIDEYGEPAFAEVLSAR